jgi:hypothetical protein
MMHLVYAVKVMINEDLKAQDVSRVRRARRRRAAKVTTPQPAVRPTPSVVPATRNAEVATPRRAANVGA